jgi:predicted transposase YdaD
MTTNYNEGFENGKKAIAIKLLKKGMDIEFVQQTTDLSIDEIKELQKELLKEK